MSNEEKPKVEEKPKAKPTPKKESKPTPKGGAIKTIEDRLEKMGYMDIYDIITLAVGVWGIIMSLIGFFTALGANANILANLAGQAFTDASNNAWAAVAIFIVQMYIYVSLALFPYFVNGGMKIINKWPESFPLHFIKTKEDFRSFIVFLSWWSCLIFWVASPSGVRWPHAISFIVLTIVLFADALRKKITALPEKKIRE